VFTYSDSTILADDDCSKTLLIGHYFILLLSGNKKLTETPCCILTYIFSVKQQKGKIHSCEI